MITAISICESTGTRMEAASSREVEQQVHTKSQSISAARRVIRGIEGGPNVVTQLGSEYTLKTQEELQMIKSNFSGWSGSILVIAAVLVAAQALQGQVKPKATDSNQGK